MASLPTMAVQRRRFLVVLPVVGLLALAFAVLLEPLFSSDVRTSASGSGLLVAGVVGTTACLTRARETAGRRQRSWLLFSAAGVVAVLGNLVVAVQGKPPSPASPGTFSNITIALALLLSIMALLNFPTPRRRGVELVLMSLDGLVVSGAMLVIGSVLINTQLDSRSDVAADRVTTLVFPILDIILATLGLLLVLRSRTDRNALVLLAVGYLLYAASDLVFAVIVARTGDFTFGTPKDLGWILGYLVIGLAAWYPSPSVDQPPPDDSGALTTAYETLLVFGVLTVAAVVQVANPSDLHPQIGLWLALLVAVGARQTLLTVDSAGLRRGLERRVSAQTADLADLARQREVLLTSVGDGIYGVDDDGRVTFINPAGAAALGFEPEQLLGRRAHQEFHGVRDDGTPYPWDECYITDAIRTGVTARAEEDVYRCRDGSSFPVEISASPLVDRQERLGAVVVFRDVTQRHEIDKLKNEFLSVVSHELRTPLTSIRGSLGLISSGNLGALTPQADRMVTIALESSERLTRLINDILDVERIDSGTLPMELVAREATQLMEASAAQIQGMANGTGVRLEVAPSSGLVMADGDRIVQTLTNLLGNAIKFSPAGSTVELSSRQVGAEVVFAVKDEGRGIPDDKLEVVFQRFEQVDSSDARQKGGSGLGLAISRGIVERHGGRIWAESEVGVGTTVYFTLPAVRRTIEDSTISDATAPGVLICDDDPDTVRVLSAMMARHGYRPIPVTNGQEAIDRVTAERPAAVVLDLLMPGTSGAQVMEELKRRDRTRFIPVVIVSGVGPASDPELADRANGWLVKPVTEQRLLQAVSVAVAGRLRETSVLIVEDDDNLAGVLRTLLAGHGLNVVHVRTVRDAVTVGVALRPQVIVLDLRLPDGDGSEVVTRLRESGRLNETAVIVYSAADVERGLRPGLELGRTVFMTKGRAGPETLEQRVLELVEAVVGAERKVDHS